MSDWPLKYKFGYFFTLHRCMQGGQAKINKSLSNDKDMLLTTAPPLVLEIVPSSYNKKRRTIHYFSMNEEWMDNKKLADKFISDDKSETVRNIIEKFNKSGGVRYRLGEFGFLDRGDWPGLIEKIKQFKNNPGAIKIEDWFDFYYNLPSPSNWMEEGMVWRYMTEMEKGKSPIGFILEAGEKLADFVESFEKSKGSEKSVKNYKRDVYPVFVRNGEVEKGELKTYEEKVSTGSFDGFAIDIKELTSALLRLFSSDSSDSGKDLTYYSAQPCLVFPIYEVYINNIGYGGIWGFYYFLPGRDIDKKLLKVIWSYVFPRLVEASHQLFSSIRWRTDVHLSQALAGGDTEISQLFLANVASAHSWENIWITKKSIEDQGGIKPEDVIFHYGWKEKDFPKVVWSKKKEKYPPRKPGKEEKNRYFQWDLTEVEFLFYSDPEQFHDEFKGRYIICEYPELCFIPEDEKEKKIFTDKIKEQQINVLEIVIKQWKQRRYAVRLAVTAIMGRNLSHNIGSHVLARYAAVAGNKGEQRIYAGNAHPNTTPPRNVVDHRTVLLNYLQRRKDFIAEICTSEQAFSYQCLDLKRVLDELNWDIAEGLINVKGKEDFKPILLSYISGKQSLTSNVKLKNNTSYSFSCPSGEVGAHALYTILENIMRNSARHNNSVAGNQILLEVEVKEPKEHPDLLELIIHDCQTKISASNNQGLIKNLNTILGNEDSGQGEKYYLLDENNKLNTTNWGIQEMRICAHYLRGFKLTELEDKLPKPLVLEAIGDNSNHLAYKLYLKRAQLCATVLKKGNFDNLREADQDTLRRYGISFFCADNVNRDDLSRYDFLVFPEEKKEEYGKIHLQLPIRMLILDEDLQSGVEELRKANNLQQWLNNWLGLLHEKIWQKYRDKRKEWEDQEIKALVDWDDDEEPFELMEQQGSFSHIVSANGGNGENDRKKLYDKWLGLLGKDKLGLVWVDHANNQRFMPTESPYLISAAGRERWIEVTRNEGEWKDDATSPNVSWEPIVFAEIIESLSLHKSFLEKLKDYEDKKLSGELISSALSRVIVLDERVQSHVEREYRDIPYNVLWRCMGIWVPSVTSDGCMPSCDLDNPDLEKIKSFLKAPTTWEHKWGDEADERRKKKVEEQLPADFMVIHLTILEKLATNDKGKTTQEILDDFRACEGVGEDCEMIVISGRGIPMENLSKNGEELDARFLPVSAILEYLNSRPSKLALMQALWSAIKPRSQAS